MALQRRDPGAAVRRMTGWALAGDVGISLIIGLLFSNIVGLIVFIIGLIVTGAFWYNWRQVLRTRGYR